MATAQQIPVLAAKLVEHQTAFGPLSTEDAQWVIKNPQNAIAVFVKAVKNRAEKKKKEAKPEPLLGPATDIVVVPDRAEGFIVQKDFAKYRGENFDRWFIGKVEEASAGAVLRSQSLLRSSTDPAIIEELGGYLKARITLADINHAEKKGELRKDVVYIGYMEDVVRFPADEAFSYINEKSEKCVLRAVDVDWDDGGWFVGADSIGSPRRWLDGIQVFSRIPVAA